MKLRTKHILNGFQHFAVLAFLILFSSQNIQGQTDANSNIVGEDVVTTFNKTEIELKKGEIVSNVLRVYNNAKETKTFTLDVIAPGTWGKLNERDKLYVIEAGDSLVIPVILIPSKTVNGNTDVTINAFLIDEDQNQIANNVFSLSTKKTVSWDVTVDPTSKFYFKNGENEKDFKFTVSNTGSYRQDIFLDYKAVRGDIILSDSTQRILKKNNTTLSLDARTDSTFEYTASCIASGDRNFKKVSLLSHRPNANLLYKKYTLFVNSSEPKAIGANSFKKGNKIEFIKLPNEIKYSNFGLPSLPLIVELNAQNVLANNSFMSLNMRGFHQLNEKASLAYFSQINYSQSYWNKNLLNNTPWYVGYFEDRLSVEAGQVSGNIIGLPSYGKGLKASYSYLEKHRTGAFFAMTPGYFRPPTTQSFGASHKYTHSENFNITAKIGSNTNFNNDSKVDVVSLNPNFNIKKKHFFTAIGALSRNELTVDDSDSTRTGYLAGLNYSTSLLSKKWDLNIGGRYNNKDFSFGSYERTTTNHRSTYEINDKWWVSLNNTFQKASSGLSNDSLGFNQELFYNTLVFSTKKKQGTFHPGLYYNITDFAFNRIRSRGLSFRYSKQKYQDNFMTSAFFKTGYRKSLDIPEAGNYFTLEFSSILRYRVWTLSTRYNYGALSNSAVQGMVNNGITPQSFRSSFQNQYQFKNSHFVLENSLVYNYHNRFQSNSLGLFPEIFYFSNTGWRFSINANFNLISNNYSNAYTFTNVNIENDRGATTNFNSNFGVSLKKEFGIPIPFAKKKAVSVDFISFFDINGNGIRDKDEPTIENVVLRVGEKEVITNRAGKATVKNISIGNHALVVTALDKEDGWFANVDDSLNVFINGDYYIPFVRGIKVYGDVVLDRQKIAIMEDEKTFDLSRIKIVASNGKVYSTLTNVKGEFEFYMPNGEYTITMDERILTSKYKLSRNNIKVTLKNSQDGVYVSFYILENKRKVVVKEFGTKE
jgi:hypothetical protein